MWNEELSVDPVASRRGEGRSGAARGMPARQRVRGISGQLRPYRDVRAGFEPWRRVALMAWAAREATRIVS